MAEQNKFDDAIVLADAPSQAHLQGTQSRNTKANLAKELAFPHTGHTLPFVAAQTDSGEARTHNIKRSRRKAPKRSPDKKRLTGAFCSTLC